MLRGPVLLLLLAAAAGAAPADDYFEYGLDYLRKGFFGRARGAFLESLVRAPGQPVPLTFSGVAAAAEGLAPRLVARLLRLGFDKLPKDKTLRLDLRRRLPSAKALDLLKGDYVRHLKRADKRERLAILTVLAFLEVQDGGPSEAPAHDLLLREFPKDRFAVALGRLRPTPRPTPASAGA